MEIIKRQKQVPHSAKPVKLCKGSDSVLLKATWGTTEDLQVQNTARASFFSASKSSLNSKSQRKLCVSESECSASPVWTASTYTPIWSFPHQPQRSCSQASSRSAWLQWAAPPRPRWEGHRHLCVCLHVCVGSEGLTSGCVVGGVFYAWQMCDRYMLGAGHRETPLGNCKRLDHSLSHAVFLLSFILLSFTQPCGETLPLAPSLPPSLHLAACKSK